MKVPILGTNPPSRAKRERAVARNRRAAKGIAEGIVVVTEELILRLLSLLSNGSAQIA